MRITVTTKDVGALEPNFFCFLPLLCCVDFVLAFWVFWETRVHGGTSEKAGVNNKTSQQHSIAFMETIVRAQVLTPKELVLPIYKYTNSPCLDARCFFGWSLSFSE
jgi:hypothetical protein